MNIFDVLNRMSIFIYLLPRNVYKEMFKSINPLHTFALVTVPKLHNQHLHRLKMNLYGFGKDKERQASISDTEFVFHVAFLLSWVLLPALLILLKCLAWKNVPKLDILFAWSSLATWAILIVEIYLYINDQWYIMSMKSIPTMLYIVLHMHCGMLALIANMYHSSNVWKCYNTCFTCGQNSVPMYPIPRSESEEELTRTLKKIQEIGPTLVSGRMIVTGTRRYGKSRVRVD